jgi:hypothetical protein
MVTGRGAGGVSVSVSRPVVALKWENAEAPGTWPGWSITPTPALRAAGTPVAAEHLTTVTVPYRRFRVPALRCQHPGTSALRSPISARGRQWMARALIIAEGVAAAA